MQVSAVATRRILGCAQWFLTVLKFQALLSALGKLDILASRTEIFTLYILLHQLLNDIFDGIDLGYQHFLVHKGHLIDAVTVFIPL